MRTLNNQPQLYQQPRLVVHTIRVEQGFAGTGDPIALSKNEEIEPLDSWE